MFQKVRNIRERENLINENGSLFLITQFGVLDVAGKDLVHTWNQGVKEKRMATQGFRWTSRNVS